MLFILVGEAQWCEREVSGFSASEFRKQKVDSKWSGAVTLEELSCFFSKASPPKYSPSFQRAPPPLGNKWLKIIRLYGTFPIQITPSLQGPEIFMPCSREFIVSSVEHCLFLLISDILCPTYCNRAIHISPNLSGLHSVTETSGAQNNNYFLRELL